MDGGSTNADRAGEAGHVEPYHRMAGVYDVVFGRPLQSGRRAAVEALRLAPGDAVLEVGVGTGITFDFYPRSVNVLGIDLSMPMLSQARRRLASGTNAVCHLARMNAQRLALVDEAFDAVYAPYVISVVPDPIAVGREMVRVCRKGGRLVILNHFLSPDPVLRGLEKIVSPLARHVGFRTDVSLDHFIAETGLSVIRRERVNLLHLSTLLTCERR